MSFRMTGGNAGRNVRRRAELGRKLTRRLSLVAKVPAALLQRANPPEPRHLEITAIAPDKSQLTVGSCAFLFFQNNMKFPARLINASMSNSNFCFLRTSLKIIVF